MKFTILAFIAVFQVIISSTALAWSPLDSFESAIESRQQCYSVIADSDDNQEGEQEEEEEEEEEEEPDCD
jgi:hypothetical protein